MIRQATKADIDAIAQTYEDLLTFEERNGTKSNWKLGLYPTKSVAIQRVGLGEMYVLEEDGQISASMALNREQAEEYAGIDWKYYAPPESVLVIHTLCIPPQRAGHGYGKQMIAYAKTFAAEIGCKVIRIDTWAHNEPAKRLYLKNGFRIAGYGPILLQRLIPEEQVYLEYLICRHRKSAGQAAEKSFSKAIIKIRCLQALESENDRKEENSHDNSRQESSHRRAEEAEC